MTTRPFALLALLALSGGCADDANRPSGEGGAAQAIGGALPGAPADSEVAAIRPGVPLDRLLDADADDEDVLADLQAPRSERADATPNAHVPGQTDTVRTYVYDGLRIESYEVAGGRTFVRRVDVTDGEYETGTGLSVGASRERIEAALGTPFQEDGEVAAYLTGPEPTPTTVEVEYARDGEGTERATAISWIPYLD